MRKVSMVDKLVQAREQRDQLQGVWRTSKRWLFRARQMLTLEQKKTDVEMRQVAQFHSENEKLKVALQLARHKIEQTLGGQYSEGQALRAALFVINQAIPKEKRAH